MKKLLCISLLFAASQAFQTFGMESSKQAEVQQESTINLEELPTELCCKIASYSGLLTNEVKDFITAQQCINVERELDNNNGFKYSVLLQHDNLALIDNATGNKEYTELFCKYGLLNFDRSRLFIKFINNNAQLINTATQECIATYSDVSTASFSKNGSLLFIRFQDKSALLVNAFSGEVIGDNYKNILTITFSNDDSLLFIHYINHTAQLINTVSGKPIANYDQIIGGTFSNNALLLLIRYQDRTVHLVSANSGNVIAYYESVLSVEFGTNNDLLLIRYRDGKVQLFKSATGKAISPMYDQLCYMQLSNNGSLFFVSYNNLSNHVISTATNEPLSQLTFIMKNASRAQFINNDTVLFIRFNGGTVQLSNMVTRDVIAYYEDVVNEQFNEDGFIILNFKNSTSQLVHAATGKILATYHDLAKAQFAKHNKLFIQFKNKPSCIIDLDSLCSLNVNCYLIASQLLFLNELQKKSQEFKEKNNNSTDKLKKFVFGLDDHGKEVFANLPIELKESINTNPDVQATLNKKSLEWMLASINADKQHVLQKREAEEDTNQCERKLLKLDNNNNS